MSGKNEKLEKLLEEEKKNKLISNRSHDLIGNEHSKMIHKLKGENDKLNKTNRKGAEENDKFKKIIRKGTEENQKLKGENDKFKKIIREGSEENQKLKKIRKEIVDENKKLTKKLHLIEISTNATQLKTQISCDMDQGVVKSGHSKFHNCPFWQSRMM